MSARVRFLHSWAGNIRHPNAPPSPRFFIFIRETGIHRDLLVRRLLTNIGLFCKIQVSFVGLFCKRDLFLAPIIEAGMHRV